MRATAPAPGSLRGAGLAAAHDVHAPRPALPQIVQDDPAYLPRADHHHVRLRQQAQAALKVIDQLDKLVTKIRKDCE